MQSVLIINIAFARNVSHKETCLPICWFVGCYVSFNEVLCIVSLKVKHRNLEACQLSNLLRHRITLIPYIVSSMIFWGTNLFKKNTTSGYINKYISYTIYMYPLFTPRVFKPMWLFENCGLPNFGVFWGSNLWAVWFATRLHEILAAAISFLCCSLVGRWGGPVVQQWSIRGGKTIPSWGWVW